MVLYIGSFFRRAYFRSKLLSDCTDIQQNYVVRDTSFITFRVQILNEVSDYQITVTQTENWINLQFWGLLLFVTVCVLWCTIFCCIWFKKSMVRCRYRRGRNVRQVDPRNGAQVQSMKTALIYRVLNNMHTGLYRNLPSKYDQPMCIVCLENFEEKSEVYLTNEWQHIFHLGCLKQWYENWKDYK